MFKKPLDPIDQRLKGTFFLRNNKVEKDNAFITVNRRKQKGVSKERRRETYKFRSSASETDSREGSSNALFRSPINKRSDAKRLAATGNNNDSLNISKTEKFKVVTDYNMKQDQIKQSGPTQTFASVLSKDIDVLQTESTSEKLYKDQRAQVFLKKGVWFVRNVNINFDIYIKEISKKLGEKSINSFQFVSYNKVEMFLNSEEAALTLALEGFIVEGWNIRVFHLIKHPLKIYISGIKPWILDEDIIYALRSIGVTEDKVLFRPEYGNQGSEIYYGVRIMNILRKPESFLPKSVDLHVNGDVHKLMITPEYIICHNCKLPGHVIRNCLLPPQSSIGEDVFPILNKNLEIQSNEESLIQLNEFGNDKENLLMDTCDHELDDIHHENFNERNLLKLDEKNNLPMFNVKDGIVKKGIDPLKNFDDNVEILEMQKHILQEDLQVGSSNIETFIVDGETLIKKVADNDKDFKFIPKYSNIEDEIKKSLMDHKDQFEQKKEERIDSIYSHGKVVKVETTGVTSQGKKMRIRKRRREDFGHHVEQDGSSIYSSNEEDLIQDNMAIDKTTNDKPLHYSSQEGYRNRDEKDEDLLVKEISSQFQENSLVTSQQLHILFDIKNNEEMTETNVLNEEKIVNINLKKIEEGILENSGIKKIDCLIEHVYENTNGNQGNDRKNTIKETYKYGSWTENIPASVKPSIDNILTILNEVVIRKRWCKKGYPDEEMMKFKIGDLVDMVANYAEFFDGYGKLGEVKSLIVAKLNFDKDLRKKMIAKNVTAAKIAESLGYSADVEVSIANIDYWNKKFEKDTPIKRNFHNNLDLAETIVAHKIKHGEFSEELFKDVNLNDMILCLKENIIYLRKIYKIRMIYNLLLYIIKGTKIPGLDKTDFKKFEKYFNLDEFKDLKMIQKRNLSK